MTALMAYPYINQVVIGFLFILLNYSNIYFSYLIFDLAATNIEKRDIEAIHFINGSLFLNLCYEHA